MKLTIMKDHQDNLDNWLQLKIDMKLNVFKTFKFASIDKMLSREIINEDLVFVNELSYTW